MSEQTGLFIERIEDRKLLLKSERMLRQPVSVSDESKYSAFFTIYSTYAETSPLINSMDNGLMSRRCYYASSRLIESSR